MAHPRRIRRTKGNLLRFEVEYGVSVYQSVKLLGDTFLIETRATTEWDRSPRSQALAVSTIDTCDDADYLYQTCMNTRERAIYNLAERVNISLDLEPRAEEGVPYR